MKPSKEYPYLFRVVITVRSKRRRRPITKVLGGDTIVVVVREGQEGQYEYHSVKKRQP